MPSAVLRYARSRLSAPLSVAMIQELFSLGPLSISPFGPLLALAFLASYWQLQSLLRSQGLGDQEDASEILLWAGIGGVLGAKIYYAVLYGDWSLLLTRSGLVWYGGFMLGAIGVTVAIRRRGLPLLPVLDAAAVSLALGYGVGRIGCFLVGDDYGAPTDLPWGSSFRSACLRPPRAHCDRPSGSRSQPM